MIVPFESAHLMLCELQPEQEHVEALRNELIGEQLVGDAWTMIEDGVVIGCAGFMAGADGQSMAWSLLSRHAGKHMIAITREVKRRFESWPRVIEFEVRVGFEAGERWARMLGCFPTEVFVDGSCGRKCRVWAYYG